MDTSAIARARGMTAVITTLAEYQTAFWAPVAETLRASGVDVLVCAFDDRSAEMLEARGVPVTRIICDSQPVDDAAFLETVARYGLKDVNLLFSHERITFRIRDTAALRSKFMQCLSGVERVLDGLIAAGRKPVLIQEFGGFLSVIASFHAARHRGVDNWFIEPAFFRGRLFFLRNSFQALDIRGPIATKISDEVAGYLNETLARRALVIPRKDRHQYTSVLAKILNRRNVRRLVEKVYDKHVLGKRQEFGHIGVYVKSHLEMAWNASRLRGIYTPLEQAGRFVYYPLHVPGDTALTLRSPEYLDQLALIDYLLRVAPPTHRVAIKEHPAQIGALSAAGIRALARRYDNLVVLPPTTNNYEVLARASAVISVNSKSGAEALLVGRPVLVLGDAFYSRSELVTRVEVLRDFSAALRAVLDRPGAAMERVRGYLQTVYDRSLPGELYLTDRENVTTFTNSLTKIVTESAEPADLAVTENLTA